ncbi:MAG: hypothetical protein HY396_00295 [Candidatus Doudnabacteria bacterium]|nr:hypothetical protein [Candidatus Doudnabacteria bacterium]
MRAYPKGAPYRPEEEKIAEKILGAAVLGTTVLISPIAGIAAFFLGIGVASYIFRKSDFNREAKRLQKKGYVALTKTEKGWLVKILKKGRQRYKEIELANLRLPRNRRWDGKWRLFIFDIPEEIRSRRDSLRQKLKSLGIYNIQRSVFAYPFDCRKELEFIAGYYNVQKFTTYAEADYIDIDRELKKHFRSLKILP